MTTKEYCTRLRTLPFGQYRKTYGVPAWRKIGKGYIVLTDGKEKPYIAPKHIWAVELEEGEPVINVYGVKGATEGLKATRPFARTTLVHLARLDKLVKIGTITYEEFVESIQEIYPEAFIPTQEQLYHEYGLTLDTNTGKVTNNKNLS